jgi:hypothetical protein
MKRLEPAHLPLMTTRAGKEATPMVFEGGQNLTLADVLVRLAFRQVGVPQGEAIKKCDAADEVDAQAAQAGDSIILKDDDYKLLVGLVEAAFSKDAMQIHGLPAGPLRLVARWLDDAVKYEPEKAEIPA